MLKRGFALLVAGLLLCACMAALGETTPSSADGIEIRFAEIDVGQQLDIDVTVPENMLKFDFLL